MDRGQLSLANQGDKPSLALMGRRQLLLKTHVQGTAFRSNSCTGESFPLQLMDMRQAFTCNPWTGDIFQWQLMDSEQLSPEQHMDF